MQTIGILLTNTGTPDAPTPEAVRRYLSEFLSDKRIVQLPRFVWLPILYGIILNTRPKRSAQLYQKIWSASGSPMRSSMQAIQAALQNKLSGAWQETSQETMQIKAIVEIGMNYGNPSISHGLEKLRQQQCSKIIVLPLFPQYSHTTTASSFDRVAAATQTWTMRPEIVLIKDYADHPDYIQSLALSLQHQWQTHGRGQHLLLSFHGIPQRYVKKGDPYASRCALTAKLLAAHLNLPDAAWTLCYQSQFGYDKWLTPSTQALFQTLPTRGIHHLDVLCPGFAVDCLETLEEIAIRGREDYLSFGGHQLNYVQALNASDAHINLLTTLIHDNLFPS